MSILEDFVKNIAQVGFIWFTSTFCNISEGKINLYIFCIFWFFIYILYLFISQGKFCLVSRCIFFSTFPQIYWEIRPRVCRHSAFSWGFLRCGIGWNFCILCSGCHNLLYFMSSFSYIIIFWLALIRHIHFCWCEVL